MHPRIALLALIASLGSSCTSAAEKCEFARSEARRAWDVYIEALEAPLSEARLTDRGSVQAVREHEKRLVPAARAAADRLYDPKSSAWVRAYEAGIKKGCVEDAECAAVKENAARARLLIGDFEERLELARAARDATTEAPALAAERATAAILHPDYPQLKAAQAATDAMAEACAIE